MMIVRKLRPILLPPIYVNKRNVVNVSHQINEQQFEVKGRIIIKDDWTNVTPKILSHVGRNLHITKNHPLDILRNKISNYFYKSFVGRTGNAIFSVYDNLDPVVSTKQNFDSLLIPDDHPSRNKSDCYYLNKEYLLRAHTTAHQAELIGMGLNNFLIFGDVYRRDEIDSCHYPVFHQADAVRLCTKDEVFRSLPEDADLHLFETGTRKQTESKQAQYTLEATKLMEHELKTTLVGLSKSLFGNDTKMRWVDAYFPFTHPSWELEILFNDKWMEVLGCGIMAHDILRKAGAQDRIGWAFGLGLERLAMLMFQIPDIRLFWTTDTGFLSQFNPDNPDIKYKPISSYPQCSNDLSFWLPSDQMTTQYSPNDFYDIARDIGDGIIEQICLVDEFKHPKTGKVSHCYRLVYRHMEKTLTQEEVNIVHEKIAAAAVKQLHVQIR